MKNIATYAKYQGMGYGRALINYISDYYKNNYKTMLVGTGEVPAILSFYESCGFEESHRIKNFFYRQLRASDVRGRHTTC